MGNSHSLEVHFLAEEVQVMEEATTTTDKTVQGVGTVDQEVVEGVMDKKGVLEEMALAEMVIDMEEVEVVVTITTMEMAMEMVDAVGTEENNLKQAGLGAAFWTWIWILRICQLHLLQLPSGSQTIQTSMLPKSSMAY
jgi:hypothetical protein